MKKTLIIFFAVAFFAAGSVSAQEKPMRIGLKFGFPNVAGLNLEYVTPAKFAPSVDFSYFSLAFDNVDASFSYFEIGSNYYFKPDGKGFYGNVSYGRIGFNGTWTDPQLGEGDFSVGLNRINLKIGAKWGNGFYFRPELGYAIGLGDSKVKVDYTDPQTGNPTTDEEELPGIFAGGPLFNIGFGVAF